MSNLKITNDTLFNFLEFLSMQDVYFETIEEKTEAIDKFLLSDFYRPLKINNPKVKITLTEWHYKCGDGCCDHYGTDVKVNGNKITTNSEDTSEILRAVFEHLGFDIEVEQKYDYE